jgi:SAM-dependent methyltransferase
MSRLRMSLLLLLALSTGLALGFHWAKSRPAGEDATVLTRVVLNQGPGLLPGGQDRALLDLIASGRQVNGSALYNFGVFNYYSALWRKYGKGSDSPAILEIGPGANLGQGMLFVATGAAKYTGLDLYRDPELDNRYSYAAAYGLLNLVAPSTVRLKAEQIFTVEGERVVFNPERIQYLSPRQSHDIGLPPGTIDFAFSHSVLEHVADPEGTFAALLKVLRKGGITAHHFDLRDHTDNSKPLEFLKVGEPEWKAQFTGANAFRYTNRWRLPDLVRSMQSTGFTILAVEPTERTPVDEAIRSQLHPDFRKYSLEDLAVVGALIVAQKP